jgi:hypothetical protein
LNNWSFRSIRRLGTAHSLFVRSSEKMPREDWIRANARLIDDVGAEQ